MTILLLLLKVIGIIFLIILGFMLFCLIHPVFYRVYAKKQEKISLKASVVMFLGVFRLLLEYQEEGMRVSIQILFFKMKQKQQQQQDTPRKTTRTAGDKPAKKRKRKLRLEQEVLFGCVHRICKESVCILKKIKPKAVFIDGDFSMGNPAWTGQVVGVLSLMPLMYEKRVRVYPDFESEEMYVKGYAIARGYFNFLQMLIPMVRVMIDRNIRKLFFSIRNRR